jgi:hypothetical protein
MAVGGVRQVVLSPVSAVIRLHIKRWTRGRLIDFSQLPVMGKF